jgi:hypothetical protein
MRDFGITILAAALCGVNLSADTHQVIKTTVAGRETVVSQYTQGGNSRTEFLSEEGRHAMMIYNSERRVSYQLDVQSRKYVEQRGDLIFTLALRIARPPRVRESGKIVNVYYETFDTGERKESFGSTAKHLVIRERHVAEPGACESTFQTEKDGWYIPYDDQSASRGYVLMAFGGPECRDTVVKHGEQRPPGVAVLETDGAMTTEVLEYSNATLDRNLFEVPSGFEKVDALPGTPPVKWSEHLAWEWAQLERAFQTWFE